MLLLEDNAIFSGMENSFKVIAITSPLFIEDEGKKISEILIQGRADLVHIRKPDSKIENVRLLIESIPEKLHPRLKLHDHFDLLDSFSLGGVHLNVRNPIIKKQGISVSRSFHSLEELENSCSYEYVTLSPIFDSISKTGYTSKFKLEQLKDYIKGKRVIALGGVTPEKFDILRETGFYGAAMLGYFW